MDVVFATSRQEKIICCCRARTWTSAIGGLQLGVCGTAGFIATIVFIAAVAGQGSRGKDEKEEDDQPNDWKEENEKTFEKALGEGIREAMSQAALMAAVILSIFSILVSAIILLLLLGNEQKRPGFFIPWFILSWIIFVLIVVGTTACMYSAKYGIALGLLLVLGLYGFILYVVHQRCSEIRAERSRSAQPERAEVYEKVEEDEA